MNKNNSLNLPKPVVDELKFLASQYARSYRNYRREHSARSRAVNQPSEYIDHTSAIGIYRGHMLGIKDGMNAILRLNQN